MPTFRNRLVSALTQYHQSKDEGAAISRILTKDDIVGIFPPVASPFTHDEEVDVPALREELKFNLSHDITGVCLGGSTGEGHALDAADLGLLIKTAVEEVKGKVPVIAGIISTSVREAARRGYGLYKAVDKPCQIIGFSCGQFPIRHTAKHGRHRLNSVIL